MERIKLQSRKHLGSKRLDTLGGGAQSGGFRGGHCVSFGYDAGPVSIPSPLVTPRALLW